MSDVYERLAKRLDQLPHGFPPTESGVELRILQKVFSPEEAEMALRIKHLPETAEAAAERLGKPVEEMRGTLDNMAAKGQIACFKLFGQQVYMLAPFVVGIYEFQVYRLDREFVELFEEYAPTLLRTIGGHKPPIARTVPVDVEVEGESKIAKYEDIRTLLQEAKSFRVMECICRKERALTGNACNYTLEACLQFSNEEGAYDYFSLGGRIISKQEALNVIEASESEGLVHNLFYDVKQGHMAVCNCCPCCCGILRGLKQYDAPFVLAKSNSLALIDEDTCSACGLCADERCPMDAILEDGDSYRVKTELCIGCGVCTVTCPTESITMVERPEHEQDIPADNMIDWSLKRAANRGIDFKLE